MDVLGVGEVQTKKFKSADDVKETEKAGQESNPDLVEQFDVCPVTKRPSIWYFQEISPDKQRIKVPQSQQHEFFEVATQTDDSCSSEVDMRLANMEKSISHILLELRLIRKVSFFYEREKESLTLSFNQVPKKRCFQIK